MLFSIAFSAPQQSPVVDQILNNNDNSNGNDNNNNNGNDNNNDNNDNSSNNNNNDILLLLQGLNIDSNNNNNINNINNNNNFQPESNSIQPEISSTSNPLADLDVANLLGLNGNDFLTLPNALYTYDYQLLFSKRSTD
jgi:hypothetical protein